MKEEERAARCIDVASSWISNKDAYYLCKEDKLVWFASLTGQVNDKDWQEMSLLQVERVIRFTLDAEVRVMDIISALQELGRVFEMGVHSEFQTSEEIFNYAEKSPMDKPEKLVRELTLVLSNQQYKGLLVKDLNTCFDLICVLAGVDTSNQKRNRHYAKYFGILNYSVRANGLRVFYKGRKVTAILHNNYRAINIQRLDSEKIKNIAALVVAKVG